MKTAYLEGELDPPVLVSLAGEMSLVDGIPAFHSSITDTGPVVHPVKALPELC